VLPAEIWKRAICSSSLGLDMWIDYAALKAQSAKGRKIGHLHLRILNPLPSI